MNFEIDQKFKTRVLDRIKSRDFEDIFGSLPVKFGKQNFVRSGDFQKLKCFMCAEVGVSDTL